MHIWSDSSKSTVICSAEVSFSSSNATISIAFSMGTLPIMRARLCKACFEELKTGTSLKLSHNGSAALSCSAGGSGATTKIAIKEKGRGRDARSASSRSGAAQIFSVGRTGSGLAALGLARKPRA